MANNLLLPNFAILHQITCMTGLAKWYSFI